MKLGIITAILVIVIGILTTLHLSLSSSSAPKSEDSPKPLPVTPAQPSPPPAIKIPSDATVTSKKLFSANLAFSVPEKANIVDDLKAQLIIDTRKNSELIRKQITQPNVITIEPVQVSRLVKATVSAPDFEVTNVTDSEQLILDDAATEWQWILVPKRPGKHSINIVVTAIITYEGKEKPYHLKTFDKTVTIEITPKQFILGWFESNWKWIISSLLIPLVGIFFKDIFKKKES